jgi:hypothetical protein
MQRSNRHFRLGTGAGRERRRFTPSRDRGAVRPSGASRESTGVTHQLTVAETSVAIGAGAAQPSAILSSFRRLRSATDMHIQPF